MYILDYTSEVEVINCTNCQVFIGPVDGPAIFSACENCRVACAAQQFQAKGCNICEFSLYCATGPTLSGCSAIKISCWPGAYPGLTQHFAAANLDPFKNQWSKVYDASAGANGESQNYNISMEPAAPWEVPIEGATGPPENPVPGPDGAMPQQQAPHPEAVDALTSGMQATNLAADEEFFTSAAPVENGTRDQSAADAAAGFGVEPPTTIDGRDRLQQRLATQAREEAEKKAAIQQAAGRYLEEFYEARTKARDERIRAGRVELARRGSGETGPEGTNQWERAISMIDFNMSRPSGTDLSRFKSVLMACKERGTTAS